jgi:hypothetical protein
LVGRHRHLRLVDLESCNPYFPARPFVQIAVVVAHRKHTTRNGHGPTHHPIELRTLGRDPIQQLSASLVEVLPTAHSSVRQTLRGTHHAVNPKRHEKERQHGAGQAEHHQGPPECASFAGTF